MNNKVPPQLPMELVLKIFYDNKGLITPSAMAFREHIEQIRKGHIQLYKDEIMPKAPTAFGEENDAYWEWCIKDCENAPIWEVEEHIMGMW